MKMQIIGSGTFQIPYPSSVTAARKHSEEPASPGTPPVSVPIDAIDSIRRCLQHDRNERMTIPELLDHAFLKPSSTKQRK
jgi:serine/threonine protein kinase